MELFFDTETTGKADFKLPPGHAVQPRLVSLAAVQVNDVWEVVQQAYVIVRPEGFTIPEDSVAIHGITTEYALKYGIPLRTALSLFAWLYKPVDTAVAFNVQFDKLVLDGEFIHAGAPNPMLEAPKMDCEMRAWAPVLKIPKPTYYGRNPGDPYKWPNLDEVAEHIGLPARSKNHEALDDVMRTISARRWRKQQSSSCRSQSSTNTSELPLIG